MPVIAAYLYRHGQRVREIAIDERIDCPSDRSEFVWIGLTDPCADEIETFRSFPLNRQARPSTRCAAPPENIP